jgi:nucleoside-diphosphate-sugar epimerase
LDNFRVICIDNVSSGNKKNIENLSGNRNFTFIDGDVRELDVKERIDYVFHLASRASPVDFDKYPINILLTNSIGTLNVLELARKNSARFLLASTSEVYGDPLRHPQKEDYFGNVNCVGPRGCYDEGKRFAEALTMAHHREHGMDVRIARIFNTYGPLMRKNDGRVIPNFITQALTGNPITVYGLGDHTRSFCYISDMVEGLKKLMFTEGLSGQVFNLGSEKEIPILEVARLIKRLVKSQSEIVFLPPPKDDPVRRKADITKARKKLNWKPKVGFEEGLKKTIEWFKGNL